jgi:hypothetical protein
MEPWPQATRIESGFLRWWSTYACVARDDLSTEALLRVRHELDGMLGRIRSTRRLSNPLFKCPKCGHIGRRSPIPTSAVLAPP